jgi:uncharacterized protein
VSNHLDRPLGQNKKAPRPPRFGRGQMVSVLLGLLVASSAAFFAFDGIPFSKPEQPPLPKEEKSTVDPAQKAPLTAEEEAKVAEASLAQSAKEQVSPPQPAGGAKIIHVNPSPNALPGMVSVIDPSKVNQELNVAHIPDPDLVEKSAQGQLPIRASDGRRPFDVYARAWSGARGARVAIVIGGMGISQTSTQTAIEKLAPEITLGFAPQGNSLSRWAQAARRKGHEILLQLPMEPFDYPRVDPGRGTLLIDAGTETNLKVLHDSMGRFTNYTGVMNYLGAKFTADPAAMEPVMADLGARGLLYLDDGTSARSATDALAASNKAPFAQGDMVIDQVQDKNEIMKALDRLEAEARSRGSAIGTGTGFDVTIDAVAEWAAGAKKRGIEIVGVAALARDPEK